MSLSMKTCRQSSPTSCVSVHLGEACTTHATGQWSIFILSPHKHANLYHLFSTPSLYVQLDEVRASRGKGSVEDGAVSVDKPLVEVLREAKAAKEADFAAKWKTMKTGGAFQGSQI